MRKTARQLLEEANAMVKSVTPHQAAELAEDLDNLFVDLRDIREVWRDGTIPGALHVSANMLEFWVDPDCEYYKNDFDDVELIVLFCTSSWRSALAGRRLIEMGVHNVVHIEGGFRAWKAAGLDVLTVLNPYER